MSASAEAASGAGPRFGRVLSAMCTPFGPDGSLNLDMAAELAKWLVDHGNEGLVIAGTTGESPALSHDEQEQLIATVVDAVDVPVVAGAGSNNTAAAIDLTERAQRAGAHGILQVAPYYNRPGQQGLKNHFTAVAQATDLPIILYDIPGRTGRKVETETILELATDLPNLVALKDAAGSPAETAWLISQAPDDFEVYSGDDVLTLPLLAVGAVGVIGVATHWTGAEHQAMFAALDAGDLAKAAEINAAMLPSFRYETGNEAQNPIPTKAIMRLIGLDVGYGRAPMNYEPDWIADLAKQVLAGTALAETGLG